MCALLLVLTLAVVSCSVPVADACVATPYVWTWEGHVGSDTTTNTLVNVVQSVRMPHR